MMIETSCHMTTPHCKPAGMVSCPHNGKLQTRFSWAVVLVHSASRRSKAYSRTSH